MNYKLIILILFSCLTLYSSTENIDKFKIKFEKKIHKGTDNKANRIFIYQYRNLKKISVRTNIDRNHDGIYEEYHQAFFYNDKVILTVGNLMGKFSIYAKENNECSYMISDENNDGVLDNIIIQKKMNLVEQFKLKQNMWLGISAKDYIQTVKFIETVKPIIKPTLEEISKP